MLLFYTNSLVHALVCCADFVTVTSASGNRARKCAEKLVNTYHQAAPPHVQQPEHHQDTRVDASEFGGVMKRALSLGLNAKLLQQQGELVVEDGNT